MKILDVFKPWAYTYLDPSNINKKGNVYLKIVDDKLLSG